MKNILKKVVSLVLCAVMFSGCTKVEDNTEELNKYKAEMTAFFEELVEIDENINAIDPTNQLSMNQLFEQFDLLEEEFKNLTEIHVPKDFENNESLALQASEYMTQANEYLHKAFSETSYNEKVLEAAMECYNRANKRVQFIISILHGELPSDDSVSYVTTDNNAQ